MKKLLILGLFVSLRALAADPILPAERQAIWQGNVGIPGGIPTYPVGVNVKNSPYNAYGDGVHDDSQAIQKAIAACPNGSAVYFPAGTYLVSTNVVIPPGYPNSYPSIALRGAGPGTTTIELGAHDDEDVIYFKHGTQLGTPTAITGGLSQNSSSITVASASGISPGTILSITQLNDTNFVSIQTYDSYNNNIVSSSATYNSSGTYTVSVSAGTTYLLTLGGYDTSCVNGGQTINGPTATAKLVPSGSTVTLHGTPNSPVTAQIMQYNGEYDCTYCGENGQRVCQQFVKVTSVSGTTLGITPPLIYSYSPSLSPQAQAYSMITNCGVESMTVKRLYPSQNSYASANCIEFNDAAWCWVTNVETCWPQGAHVKLSGCFQCQIEDCYFHDGWSQCSGQDYGVWIFNHNSHHLIENSIFVDCRHSMIFEAGGAACVFAYNFSTNAIAGESTSSFLGEDEVTHGAHAWYNLYEGNIATRIVNDYAHGSGSDNTYFRQNLDMVAYAPANVLAIELANWNSSESPVPQTSAGFPGGWVTGPGVQSSGTYGVDVETWNYSNNVVGCIFTTNSPGPTTFAVTNLTTTIDAGPGVIDRCGYQSPGSYGYPIDGKSQTTTYWHGNWDPITKAVQWNAANTDHTIPKSLYLTSAPSWWGTNAWPPIGPDCSPSIGMIPALARYEAIVKPSSPPTLPVSPPITSSPINTPPTNTPPATNAPPVSSPTNTTPTNPTPSTPLPPSNFRIVPG